MATGIVDRIGMESRVSPAFGVYVEALQDFLAGPNRRWMENARELGAAALRIGWHGSHVLVLHQDALAVCVDSMQSVDMRRKAIRRAPSFLEEALSPFERFGDRYYGPLFATRTESRTPEARAV